MDDYYARVEKQLENWVVGISTHNIIDDECCPDFSCCKPELFEPARERRLTIANVWRERHGYAKWFDD